MKRHHNLLLPARFDGSYDAATRDAKRWLDERHRTLGEVELSELVGFA